MKVANQPLPRVTRITAFATILFLVVFNSSEARAQGDRGNGGDIYAQEYAAIAEKIYKAGCETTKIFESILDCKVFKEMTSGLTQKPNYIKVTSAKMVYGPDNKPRDAINNPDEHKITISRLSWRDMVEVSARVGNISHEYATLLGIDSSDDYRGSNQMIEALKISKIDLTALATVKVLDTTRIDLFNAGKGAIVCDSETKDDFGNVRYIRFNNQSWSFYGAVMAGSTFLDGNSWERPINQIQAIQYYYDIEDGIVKFHTSGVQTDKSAGNFITLANKKMMAFGIEDDKWQVVIDYKTRLYQHRFSPETKEVIKALNINGNVKTSENGYTKLHFRNCHLD